ncbi:MAG TPA: hypothetical protein VM934_03205 [Pyrinomonadaceae bacterium]|jgi:predicted nucleotidyltransferase|nr:hypothetical protein [Pyrinomonadaceae bacterium]
MPLPAPDSKGDLPEGLHPATLDEIVERFGRGTPRRQAVAKRLIRIYEIVQATNKLDRFVIFGSFVTSKPEPNDVDIVLVMRDDFDLKSVSEETAKLFNHAQAEDEFGASIFWVRPSLLILESADEFLAHWQLKRDGTRRGIVEVKA